MAVIQDEYNDAPGKGFPGQRANMETSNVISRTVEDAAGMAFGSPAFRGTGDRGTTATPADGDDLGFVVADHGQPLLPGGTADTVPQYESAAIETQGAVYVTVVGSVEPGDAVTVGVGAGAADGIGNTAADATHIAMRGWEFDETVTDGLCLVVRR